MHPRRSIGADRRQIREATGRVVVEAAQREGGQPRRLLGEHLPTDHNALHDNVRGDVVRAPDASP
jgi:hypothetical protein